MLRTARTLPAGVEDSELFVASDSTTPEGVATIAAAARERLGGVDALVHTVGGSAAAGGDVTSLGDDDWMRVLQLNLLSAVRLDRALVPSMRERGSGTVVHVTSIQSRMPLANTIPYAAAKAALTSYSKGLAREVASDGVRVVAVAPGFIETAGAAGLIATIQERGQLSEDDARKQIVESLGGIPVGHPGSPGDVASLIAFLVSPEGRYMTGTEIVIDGGAIPTT